MRKKQNLIFVVFFLFQHLMNSFYLPCGFNRSKLERVVIFMKNIAKVVPLIFTTKTLLWNKMVLPAAKLLKVIELVENELEKIFAENT